MGPRPSHPRLMPRAGLAPWWLWTWFNVDGNWCCWLLYWFMLDNWYVHTY